MILSVIVALTLTPALCASLLDSNHQTKTTGFFHWFNNTFESVTKKYERKVLDILKKPIRWMLFYFMRIKPNEKYIARKEKEYTPRNKHCHQRYNKVKCKIYA